MSPLNLPPIDAKIVQRNNIPHIFDNIRSKYVTLTPEEWVRQHFVGYLTGRLGYPAGLIANEMSIILNGTKKRCDTVVYNCKLEPVVLVEYKSPEVTITQKTFLQIMRYNMVLRVPWLIVSNGLEHYCCRVLYDENRADFCKEIPPYSEISNS